MRIVIDPGHGGIERTGNSSCYGSRGPSGLLEKDVTLDIAKRVVERLGGGATLTRTGDSNLSLGARARRASSDGADVFVSIHANSGGPNSVGPETWVHPQAGAESRTLAAGVQGALDQLRGRYGSSTEPLPGPMAVLDPNTIGRRTAACLVEVDYLSHPEGERRLGDPRQRAAIGAAIADAISAYVGGHRSLGGRRAYGDRPSPDPYIIPDPSAYVGTGIGGFARVWGTWFGNWSRWRAGVPSSALSHFPHSAICELELSGAGWSGFGTGFYIGPNKILTCGHNFSSGGSVTTSVNVRPGKPAAMSVTGHVVAVTSSNVIMHPNWVAREDDNWDMAILHVPSVPAPHGRYFQMPNMTPAGTEQVVVCGYGKFQSDGSGNDFGEGQYMDGGHLTHATQDQYHFPIQSIPGHSGSPLFWNEMVIGILTGPRMLGATTISDHENRAVRLTPEKNDWINAH